MALMDIAVEKAKSHVKGYRLADSGGLFMFVTPAGGKSWRWKYLVDGKQKLMTFGLYPDVSLSEARELRDRARRQKNKCADLMAARKTAKLIKRVAAENSFATVAKGIEVVLSLHWSFESLHKHDRSPSVKLLGRQQCRRGPVKQLIANGIVESDNAQNLV